MRHKPPGQQFPGRGAANVMPDLANAMKQNPNLKILLMGGYYDLATPYYEGWYEMHQLPIPDSLQKNIQYHYYQSGHMVYAHEQSLKRCTTPSRLHQFDQQREVMSLRSSLDSEDQRSVKVIYSVPVARRLASAAMIR